LVSDDRVFVLIQPGDPDDFEPGGRLLGVTGEPVSDVGDEARWFGGGGADGGGTAGVLSVRQDTRLGVLYFRVGLGRPDLTSGEQLAVATKLASRALPRFPGLEALAPIVPLVNLCELVSDTEAEGVLAGYRDHHPATRDEVFVIGSSALVDLRDSGDLTCQKLILAEIYIDIQQASSDDFEGGAEVAGVVGEPVPGIGEEAVWFGGVPFQDSFTAPHEQGILSVRYRDAFFRIVLALPDTNSADQLDIARDLTLSALTRIPGYVPVQERVEILIESEPFDRSEFSYVDNLIEKEASGEWTRGEGLVATLRMLAEEVDPASVLRHESVFDTSGTRVIQLAADYVDNGDETNSRAEIERLLATLLGDLEPTTGDDAEALGRIVRVSTVSFPQTQTPLAQETECLNTLGGAFGMPRPKFCERPVAEETFGIKYTLDAPTKEWKGWEPPFSVIEDAISKTASRLEKFPGEMPSIEVETSPWSLLRDGVGFNKGLGKCKFVLGTQFQTLLKIGADLAGQAIAEGMAECYHIHNFGPLADPTWDWWSTGLSWYLSDLVYPNASLEIFLLSMPQKLADQELDTDMLDRNFTNMAFYEYLHVAIGEDGIFAFAETVASLGQYQEGMDPLLHEYAKTLSDAVILDQAGFHEYVPPAKRVTLSAGTTVTAVVDKFGTTRVQVTVEGGEYACLEYPDAGNLLASYREGPAGGGGSWVSELPTSVQGGESVFVFTTTKETQGFRIEVVDTGDNEECEDDEEGEEEEEEGVSSQPPTVCDFCEPSRFYQSLRDGLQEIIEN
jgi:hypothetical protein